MKNLSIINRTAILFLLFQGFPIICEAQGKYKIDGTITGFSDGKIYMLTESKIDSVQVTKGKFHISGELQAPVEYMGLAKTSDEREMIDKAYVSFFVEAAPMTLQLNYADFSITKMKGSKTQEDVFKCTAITDKIRLKYKKELDHFDAVEKKYDDAVNAKKSEEVLEAIKYESNDARSLLWPMYKETEEVHIKFMKDNPQSYYSMYLLSIYTDKLTYAEAKSYYDSFNPLYKKGELSESLAADIEKMKKGIPGAAAGPFKTKDINGNPLKLEDFKGKYVLIDFWASWCVPCRKGNPHLLKLYEEYKPKGLEILGVAHDDENEDKWKKAVEKDGIGVWRHVLAGVQYKEGTYERINLDQDISEGYNISSLPTKILVDPKGMIVARYDGAEDDDKKMDQDLAAIFAKK
ncbi:MAG: AhpC/TSA family protein [Flavobacterium sp.]|uniref:TlpA disulfide reductase family protein n=1 Tax=Flavobacterium sp. TaxID=239 RepID=UPI001B11FB9E|nr:TlpA disulfide reductase family protein [Flavobacterium sp.]MBO9585317.1 AhpC/TSA family protein [Flavobacterium sp.]